MKEKFSSLFNLIKTNKTTKYIVVLSVVVLFCLALNVTYSAFTSNNTTNVANLKINDLSYNLNVNSNNTDILSIPVSNSTTNTIKLTSLNNFETRYELSYQVCQDSSCTSYTDLTSDIKNKVKIRHNTSSDALTGTIGSNQIKTITLVTENFTSNTYYIKLFVKAGYSSNSLALDNKIFEKTNDEDLKVVSVIDGVQTTYFPSTEKYTTSTSCTGSGVSLSVTWNGSKWVASVSGLSQRNVTCTAYFTLDDSSFPSYKYTGTLLYTDEGNGNWHVTIKSGGTLTIDRSMNVDVFLVGGGTGGQSGQGGSTCYGGSGGRGGYYYTVKNIKVNAGSYSISIGSGGAGGTGGSGASQKSGSAGGATTAFGYSSNTGTSGASGGQGARLAGADTSSMTYATAGSNGVYAFGTSSTDGVLYGAGGGGAECVNKSFVWTNQHGNSAKSGGATGGGHGGLTQANGSNASANTGSGGGGGGADMTGGQTGPGYGYNGGTGGSGILIIRNKR